MALYAICGPDGYALSFHEVSHDDAPQPQDGQLLVPLKGRPGIAPEPRNAYRFSAKIEEWVDTRTLEDHQAEQWEAIKAARSAAEMKPFQWDGSVFDADPARINGAVTSALVAQAVGQPWSVEWTLANNTRRTLTGPEMIQVGLALAAQVGAAHARGRDLRDRLAMATTNEQVSAITW